MFMRTFGLCLLLGVMACDKPVAVAPPPVVPPPPLVSTTTPPTQDPPRQDPIDEKSLAVDAVTEPEWPLLKSDEEIRKAGASPMPGGGYHVEKKGVPSVIVPGKVLMTRGVIELLGCAEGGKEHESILRLDCDIQALNLALILSRFTGGPVPEKLGQEDKQGSRIVVLIQWKDGDKVVTHRAEDLVINLKRRSTMPRVGWTYVGAFVEVENAVTPNAKEKQKVLAATGSRSLITTWRDGSTLLDNPLPDAVDDTAYAANHVVLPPSGTVVSVILRGPTKDESGAIATLEKELAK
jgi:hypothetical protein